LTPGARFPARAELFLDELQGNRAAQAGVPGFVDDAHAAFAQPAFDAVVGYDVAGRGFCGGFQDSAGGAPQAGRAAFSQQALYLRAQNRFDSRLVLGGPAWLDDQLYDLTAKLPPGALKDRVPVMLQTLLAERFKLAVHRETKEQRVYFLVVAKNGPKLKETLAADDQGVQQLRGDRLTVQLVRGGIMGHSMHMGALAASLADVAGYQVVDHTALTGMFDINLKWTPEDSKGIGPDLFTAIQEQLGLKLESGKAPVEMLMIDHAERIPSEN
jgi:uncharacterized protein (TIGR03435 family)